MSLELPAGFRVADILAFHQRDPLAVAERVGADSLQKGLAWNSRPACLTINFTARSADVELAIDGPADADGKDGLSAMARRMLGLTQPVEAFERGYRDHPQLGPLIARRSGLRVPLASSPFEALAWAVTGQQISLAAAISLRRKLILAAGLQHSGGLACFPDAGRVAEFSADELRAAGFSRAKAETLIALSRLVIDDQLPLEAWLATLPVDEIRERLGSICGIGPWTIDYALLRGFGWLDGSLHGDAAVRRKLQALLGAADRIGEAQARQWLAPFSPWRALVAAHLWAM